LLLPAEKLCRVRSQRLRKTKKPTRNVRVILVAEDEDDDFLLLEYAYRDTGLPHKLRRVLDGRHLVQYLQNCTDGCDPELFPRPDLLLLDLKMPGMGGFEVLHWLRRSLQWSKLPVVILSGSDEDRDRQKALALGARAYFVKAIKLEETQQMLKIVCEQWLQDAALSLGK